MASSTLRLLSRAFGRHSLAATNNNTSLIAIAATAASSSSSLVHPNFNRVFSSKPSRNTKFNISFSDSDDPDDEPTKTIIKVNSPHFTNIVIKDPLPNFHTFRLNIVAGPDDPEAFPELLNKVHTFQGFMKGYARMVDNLLTDGYDRQASEIKSEFVDKASVPKVLTLTAVIEEYADAGKTKEVLQVYRNMLARGVSPNAYSLSVVIRALVKDSNFVGDAKDCVMEMMGLGMQPNATTYTALFEVFSNKERAVEGRELLDEMKGKGFVADEKAVWEVLKDRRKTVLKRVIDFLFDPVLTFFLIYSNDSFDDDYDLKNKGAKLFAPFSPDLEAPLIFCKKHIIEDDPENPKDLQQVFDKMRTTEPLYMEMSRMVLNLLRDGFRSQAEEIREVIEKKYMPEIVVHTGVMEIYAKVGKTKEVLRMYLRMLACGATPNGYTYSVLIRALAKDRNFLGDAKKYLLEMMTKGMQPNARTYTSVFEAITQWEEDTVIGKEFLKQMRASGFRANEKAVREVLPGRREAVVEKVIKTLFGNS